MESRSGKRAGQEMLMELYAINPVLNIQVLTGSAFLCISTCANMLTHKEPANLKNVKSESQELDITVKRVRLSQEMIQEL